LLSAVRCPYRERGEIKRKERTKERERERERERESNTVLKEQNSNEMKLVPGENQKRLLREEARKQEINQAISKASIQVQGKSRERESKKEKRIARAICTLTGLLVVVFIQFFPFLISASLALLPVLGFPALGSAVAPLSSKRTFEDRREIE
jgi:hypothetical protein